MCDVTGAKCGLKALWQSSGHAEICPENALQDSTAQCQINTNGLKNIGKIVKCEGKRVESGMTQEPADLRGLEQENLEIFQHFGAVIPIPPIIVYDLCSSVLETSHHPQWASCSCSQEGEVGAALP